MAFSTWRAMSDICRLSTLRPCLPSMLRTHLLACGQEGKTRGWGCSMEGRGIRSAWGGVEWVGGRRQVVARHCGGTGHVADEGEAALGRERPAMHAERSHEPMEAGRQAEKGRQCIQSGPTSRWRQAGGQRKAGDACREAARADGGR
eukprot:353142-Chlamydomonas_euryale.AAC.3